MRKCNNCGHEINNAKDKFCANCGKKLEETKLYLVGIKKGSDLSTTMHLTESEVQFINRLAKELSCNDFDYYGKIWVKK